MPRRGKKRALTKEAILQAMDEYTTLGPERVHEVYGFRDSLMFDVVDPRSSKARYPSKAIYGMAFGHLKNGKALHSRDFFGGTEATAPLENHGFKIYRKSVDGYEFADLSEPLPRESEKLAFRAIKIRRGQRKFRLSLMKAYGGKCAISGTKTAQVLDAAHVCPHSKEGDSSVRNGILLRTDLHTLFDEHLLKINPKSMKVVIDKSVKEPEYLIFSGRKIFQPRNIRQQIDRVFLQERWLSA